MLRVLDDARVPLERWVAAACMCIVAYADQQGATLVVLEPVWVVAPS